MSTEPATALTAANPSPSPSTGSATSPPAAAGGTPPAPGAATSTATPASPGAAAPAASPSTGAAAPTTGVQADWRLKPPEGLEAGDALAKFETLAKEAGLKPEAAQAAVELWAAEAKASQAKATAAQAAQLDQLHASWTTALKADREVGGAEFDANTQVARRAMAKFATPELRGFLEETGLGNHPELVRFMFRVGKALSEDSVAGTAGGNAARSDARGPGGIDWKSVFNNSPELS